MPNLTIEIEDRYLYALLVDAVRYSLGRTSYVVGETSDIVRQYAHLLDPGQRSVIARDIRRHGTYKLSPDSTCSPYGSASDEAAWMALAEFVEGL